MLKFLKNVNHNGITYTAGQIVEVGDMSLVQEGFAEIFVPETNQVETTSQVEVKDSEKLEDIQSQIEVETATPPVVEEEKTEVVVEEEKKNNEESVPQNPETTVPSGDNEGQGAGVTTSPQVSEASQTVETNTTEGNEALSNIMDQLNKEGEV